jgi:hypothetical protein
MNKMDIRKMEMTNDDEVTRRILYSLKLSLRLLNGKFKDTKVFRFNQSSLSFDQKFQDKTTLECWYKPGSSVVGGASTTAGGISRGASSAADDEDDIAKLGGLMISPGKPRMFKAGAIIENADELVEGKEYRFYMFKVVVGKSYCYRRKKEE